MNYDDAGVPKSYAKAIVEMNSSIHEDEEDNEYKEDDEDDAVENGDKNEIQRLTEQCRSRSFLKVSEICKQR